MRCSSIPLGIERFFPRSTRAMMIPTSIESYFSWVLFGAVLTCMYIWIPCLLMYYIQCGVMSYYYVHTLVYYLIFLYINYIHSLNCKLIIFLFIPFSPMILQDFVQISSSQLRLGHETHYWITCILSTFMLLIYIYVCVCVCVCVCV